MTSHFLGIWSHCFGKVKTFPNVLSVSLQQPLLPQVLTVPLLWLYHSHLSWSCVLKLHYFRSSNLCIFSYYLAMLLENVLALSDNIFLKYFFSVFHQKKIKLLYISLLGHTILLGIKMFSIEAKLSRIIIVFYVIRSLVVCLWHGFYIVCAAKQIPDHEV